MGIGILERTSQDWAAMFGHYGEVASIDLHLRRKFRKAMFFWREVGGLRSKQKTSMKFNYPACLFVCLFVCWFCFVRVDFLRIRSYGEITMKKTPFVSSEKSKVKGEKWQLISWCRGCRDAPSFRSWEASSKGSTAKVKTAVQAEPKPEHGMEKDQRRRCTCRSIPLYIIAGRWPSFSTSCWKQAPLAGRPGPHHRSTKNPAESGTGSETTLGHDLEGCKAEPKKVEKINNLLFESSGWNM